MHFVPSRDGLNVPSFDAGYFFFPPLLSLDPLVFISLSLSLSSFSLHRPSRPRSPFALTFLRGRRQLPQAGEVRRPRRARGVVEVVGENEVSSDT